MNKQYINVFKPMFGQKGCGVSYRVVSVSGRFVSCRLGSSQVRSSEGASMCVGSIGSVRLQ